VVQPHAPAQRWPWRHVRVTTIRGQRSGGCAARASGVAGQAGGATEGPSFDQLFTRYQGPIYRHILGLVGDPAQAEDLTQDTFLKAYKALPSARAGAVGAWLYRIATHTAYDALRHRRRLAWLPFAPGDAERLPAPLRDLPTDLAEHEAVGQALARLSPRQRACLLLRARDGFSIDEIAQVLCLSTGAVKMTLYRAKERFRAAYAAPDAVSCSLSRLAVGPAVAVK
jgi:RNA polymerase sigma-70 factor (ECF subfamily)